MQRTKPPPKLEIRQNRSLIKRWAKQAGKGVRLTDFIVLAPQNDPFYIGSDKEKQWAKWFKSVWDMTDCEYTSGIHLRSIHYRYSNNIDDPRGPDGTPYYNTEEDWKDLQEASRYARILGYIDPTDLVDRRNPNPHIYYEGDDSCIYEPQARIDPDQLASLTEYDSPGAGMVRGSDFKLPDIFVRGYDYTPIDQPYIIEVWIEKSTMNNVLLPVCRNLHVNLVTSVGFQSITNIIRMLRRIHWHHKPTRIFYISDFDPAGDAMPVAVARQLEYWQPEYAPDADIKLHPVALTKEQVIEYELPRKPIKKSNLGKANFEDRYGEGAVELDALEGLYPGTLAEIVENIITDYRDDHLSEKLHQTESDAEMDVTTEWENWTEQERAEIDGVEREMYTIGNNYRAEVAKINKKMQAELEPYLEAIKTLLHVIREKAENFNPDIPDRPEPETYAEKYDQYLFNVDTGEQWLFDSRRDYLDQLDFFKARQNGQKVTLPS